MRTLTDVIKEITDMLFFTNGLLYEEHWGSEEKKQLEIEKEILIKVSKILHDINTPGTLCEILSVVELNWSYYTEDEKTIMARKMATTREALKIKHDNFDSKMKDYLKEE